MAGVHPGGARGQLSGAVVEHKRGRSSDSEFLGESTDLLQQGNPREHT